MVSFRRSRRLSHTNWDFLDVKNSSFDTMSVANSETSTSSRRRDTGFPESFCGREYPCFQCGGFTKLTEIPGRNTTLPHPEADTSPNACISQEDIAVSRALTRHRRSFLAKHKRTVSHGLLTPGMQQMCSEADPTAVASDSDGSPTLADSARLPTITGVTERPTSGGGDSFASASTGDHDDAVPDSPQVHSRLRMSTDSGALTRRKSFMQKMGIRRHHD